MVGLMAGAAHPRSAVAAFQDGEQRLVFARYRDGRSDELYYLEDGTAHEVRRWARDNLECFLVSRER
jgi:hypothetical protein